MTAKSVRRLKTQNCKLPQKVATRAVGTISDSVIVHMIFVGYIPPITLSLIGATRHPPSLTVIPQVIGCAFHAPKLVRKMHLKRLLPCAQIKKPHLGGTF